ncbi:class I SAM-dependent methyltransferase [Pedobacter sp. R-06]|uniref:class I SAM-dependent methyltransferase n=1 Tax=Pedobacter sp. R-06 TaxID=3404051 RepID=UPI003CEA31E8
MKVSDKTYSNVGNSNILQFINKDDCRVLDIGCGAGDNAKILKGQNHFIDGITLSDAEKKIADQYFENVYIFDLENGLPSEVKNNHYDYILCSHVLEHIAFPEKLLKDLEEITSKQETKILVALPNIMYYKTRIKIALGNFDYTDDGIMDYTHLRWYTIKSAKKLFLRYNFAIQTSYVDGLPPFYSFFKILGINSVKNIKKLLFFISPSFFGSEIVFELIHSPSYE